VEISASSATVRDMWTCITCNLDCTEDLMLIPALVCTQTDGGRDRQTDIQLCRHMDSYNMLFGYMLYMYSVHLIVVLLLVVID